MKYMVIGYSGCGKSTLAKHIAEHFNLPLLYLDKTYWLPNWVSRDLDEQIQIVSEFMNSNDSWVIDGTYPKVLFEQRAKEADVIVVLQLNRFACLIRAYKRYFEYQNKQRESFPEGLKESMDPEFVKKILYKGRDKRHRQVFQNIIDEYKDKTVIIKSQKELDEYKNKINGQ